MNQILNLRLFINIFIVSVSLFLAILASAAEVQNYEYKITGKLPMPKDAFTQGLTVDGDNLWLSTGKYGKSKIYQLDLKSGKIIRSKKLNSNFFGEGVTQTGDEVIQLTWKSGLALVYNKETLKIIDYFSLPGEGWGITTHGSDHFISGGLNKIHVLDTKTKKVTSSFDVKHGAIPVGNLNELEFINGFIFANIWTTDVVVGIDPKTGKVVGYFDFKKLIKQEESINPGHGVLNGIAWNSQTQELLITGKNFKNIYKVVVSQGPLSKIKK